MAENVEAETDGTPFAKVWMLTGVRAAIARLEQLRIEEVVRTIIREGN